MSKIFVYGTLKRGLRAHHFLEKHQAEFLKEARTSPEYHLYAVGWFPGMVHDPDREGGVSGELYEVDETCLNALDVYEGAPTLFARSEIVMDDGEKVITYLFQRDVSESSHVKDGVWE